VRLEVRLSLRGILHLAREEPSEPPHGVSNRSHRARVRNAGGRRKSTQTTRERNKTRLRTFPATPKISPTFRYVRVVRSPPLFGMPGVPVESVGARAWRPGRARTRERRAW
jgi:hypothetical protein